MAYICYKPPGSCPSCEHYRPDPDSPDGMACWAKHDEEAKAKVKPKAKASPSPNQHPCAGCDRYMNCEECLKSFRANGELICVMGSRKGNHRYCFRCRKDAVCERLHQVVKKR